jgi:predicted Zn finger-like uncharacterized protein
MTLARCPHCATTFRATAEQLEQRGGKVRCGKCRRVFNALENLLDNEPELPLAAEPPPSEGDTAPAAVASPPLVPPNEPAAPSPLREKAPDLPDMAAQPFATPRTEAAARPPGRSSSAGTDTPEAKADKKRKVKSAKAEEVPRPAPAEKTEATLPEPGATRREIDTLTEAQREAAQAARLSAARDTRQLPGFKWAEGTLSAPDTHFEEPKGAPWLTMVVAFVLSLMLIAQLAHHFRTELAAHWPSIRPWLEEACVSLNCTVPYPRDSELISLEGSELSIDETRGNLLVLNFTLKNRAEFPQDYPAVELTLTDVQNNIVVRRILPPGEYLPPTLETSQAFAAGAEVAAHLWIDAKDTGAVGYSLYVFYP